MLFGLLWQIFLTRGRRRASCCCKTGLLLAPTSLSFENAPCWNACPSRLLYCRHAFSLPMARYLVLNDLPTKPSLDWHRAWDGFYKCGTRSQGPFMVQCRILNYPAVDWTFIMRWRLLRWAFGLGKSQQMRISEQIYRFLREVTISQSRSVGSGKWISTIEAVRMTR